jgi:hypothetical protein
MPAFGCLEHGGRTAVLHKRRSAEVGAKIGVFELLLAPASDKEEDDQRNDGKGGETANNGAYNGASSEA